MAEPAPTWTLLANVAQRLSDIRVERGYRTDIGDAVVLEPAQHPDDSVEGLTLVALAIQRDANQPQGRHRVLSALAEATVPVSLVDAHARCHAIAADVEAALTDRIPLSGALPVQIEDIVFLDRPEGLPVVAVQIALSIHYRA
ncbi:hypothetical protein ABIE09_001778 [Lysobacter enzymogenes]|uniref:hypothetical protein n=1 Tax=Lysobacter enzymogenes TaxID=69 RepID=UPI003395C2FC